jgi:hypothetical protein
MISARKLKSAGDASKIALDNALLAVSIIDRKLREFPRKWGANTLSHELIRIEDETMRIITYGIIRTQLEKRGFECSISVDDRALYTMHIRWMSEYTPDELQELKNDFESSIIKECDVPVFKEQGWDGVVSVQHEEKTSDAVEKTS